MERHAWPTGKFDIQGEKCSWNRDNMVVLLQRTVATYRHTLPLLHLTRTPDALSGLHSLLPDLTWPYCYLLTDTWQQAIDTLHADKAQGPAAALAKSPTFTVTGLALHLVLLPGLPTANLSPGLSSLSSFNSIPLPPSIPLAGLLSTHSPTTVYGCRSLSTRERKSEEERHWLPPSSRTSRTPARLRPNNNKYPPNTPRILRSVFVAPPTNTSCLGFPNDWIAQPTLPHTILNTAVDARLEA